MLKSADTVYDKKGGYLVYVHRYDIKRKLLLYIQTSTKMTLGILLKFNCNGDPIKRSPFPTQSLQPPSDYHFSSYQHSYNFLFLQIKKKPMCIDSHLNLHVYK